MTDAMAPAVDTTTETKDYTFSFKKDKLGNKRASVEIKGIKVPSAQGLVDIVNAGGKPLELVLELMADAVRSQAAQIVSEDEKISQSTFPFANVTFDYIANMPKADRRSNNIDAAVWEAFCKDYIETMPAATGKTVEAVTNATLVYMKKFSIVKTDKGVLGKLKEQLGLYMEASKQAEQFTDILELLTSKVDTYLAANDVQMLVANL